MVCTAKKGQRKEYKARKELEADGWFIAFKSIRNRMGCIDFGHEFDIVSYRGKERKYISCKHFGKSNYYLQHQEEIREFKKEYGLPIESYELWIWESPRWRGRGKNKSWFVGGWIKLIIE